MEDNVVQLPEKEQEEVEEDFPVQYMGYISMVAAEVFGDDIGFSIAPAKTEENKPVIVMLAGSLQYEDIVRKAIFNLTGFAEIRKACIVIAYEIFALEDKYKKTAGGRLIVPNTGLIIPK
jgi:hypothetical protein